MPGFQGWIDTEAGRVPQVSTSLTSADKLGTLKARLGIGRMDYMVPPGLYAVGKPTTEDPVLVTANYKMSYDAVRAELAGRNVWLLVLETFGINVWCAAGKGTFGTSELVRRINRTGLSKIVSHRRLFLPILGAPGVAAHEVTRRTGFLIKYAAIRAHDIPEFLDNGMETTPSMRQLTFTIRERLVLVPVELMTALKTTSILGALFFLFATFVGGLSVGIGVLVAYLGAVIGGILFGPALLPWLPGRSFAVKGAITGFIWTAIWYCAGGASSLNVPAIIGAFLTLPALSAFYTLNFTGCTTFTSRSGVKKEMRLSLPVMGTAFALSAVVILFGRLF